MSGGLVDKVYIGLDNAPAAFDIKSRILGPNGTNLEYIRSETGVVAVLKADKFEPLHLSLHHTRSEALTGARSLALNLIETIRAELAQWSAAQAGGPPPALNVPPPALVTTAPPPVPPPTSVTFSTAPTPTSSQAPILAPPPTVATSTPLMTVRQPTVLQLLPQQQYVLNQENGQLIPIVQPGVQMQSNFTSLPLAQPLSMQQPNFGTQIVDISNMQPMNVTQFRLSGVPSSMQMILPNGFSFPQAQLSTSDSTTVSSATSTPVVCAAPSNSAHKILYSTDKDNVQWTVPGSQTMLIPYHQLQELTSNQNTLGIQPQQFVSIAPAGGLPHSLPLSAAQLHQLQATGGTIMHLNQKPIVSSGSLINIISTGQASSPHVISSAVNQTKHMSGQEARGQKRLADGTPNQLQLRPIAPAGSHVTNDKSGSRDSRSWTTASGRDTAVTMGMKINPAHGTIIHVSSGQQSNASGSQDTGMYIRQNTIQVATKDGQKQDLNKIQGTQNVQMITVPQGMTVLQNPLNISQMPMLGQPNSQVYMIPANHQSLVQGGLQQGIIGQQVLQHGQNVTVMQPNQLGMPGVQYNVPIMNMPMNVQTNQQYMPAGINLNAQISAQQLNALAGQQLTNNINNLPIVQAQPPASPLPTPPQISVPITQPPPQQVVSQNFIPPTTQYSNMPPQYMMQTNPGSVPNTNHYNIPSNQPTTPTNGNGQTNTASTENDSTNGNNQANYNITSQDNGFNQSPGPSFPNEGNGTPNQSFNQTPPVTQSSYSGNGNGSYGQTSGQPPANYNPSNGANQSSNQSYSGTPPTTQSPGYSPSSTPGPNNYQSSNMNNMSYPSAGPNPYPNASGQPLPYPGPYYGSRPWCRPRYGPAATAQFPPPGPPMAHPPPTSNYNYWQDS